MKKLTSLVALGMTLAMATSSVFAAGGAASAGQSIITPMTLEAKWDGSSGVQQTVIGGVIAQWNASQQGEVASANYVPSGWGAPAEIMIVSYQSVERDQASKLATAVSSYRPSAWGAPATLAHLTVSDSNTYAGLTNVVGAYSSALKLHR